MPLPGCQAEWFMVLPLCDLVNDFNCCLVYISTLSQSFIVVIPYVLELCLQKKEKKRRC